MIAPDVSTAACSFIWSGGRFPIPPERSTAMSLRGSKTTALALYSWPPPPGWTTVSFSPATTCAFVTTSPGAATQPEPSMPSPHAVPRTRTVLRAAARTWGSRAARLLGRGSSGTLPWTEGNGSKRASRFRKLPDGGR